MVDELNVDRNYADMSFRLPQEGEIPETILLKRRCLANLRASLNSGQIPLLSLSLSRDFSTLRSGSTVSK
jgi:hypothetical protein